MEMRPGRLVSLLAAVVAVSACDDEPPFRSLTVSMRIAKTATDQPTATVIPLDGPIATGDPDLSCKLKRDARPRAGTIECVRASTEETVSASFSCPGTGPRSGETVGWLVVNSPKVRVSHSFSADCSYGK